jgi:hypothetical protein
MAKNLIDNVYEKLNSNRIMEGMEDLINGLREIRLNSSEKESAIPGIISLLIYDSGLLEWKGQPMGG